MSRQHILEKWNELSKVLPANIGEIQRTEMRRSFFAGAAAMFCFITGDPLIVGQSDDASAAVLDDVHHEIEDYADRLRRGVA